MARRSGTTVSWKRSAREKRRSPEFPVPPREKEILALRKPAAFVAIVMSLSSTAFGSNGNVLSNGTFDVDVAGWTAVGDATIDWSPLDADGDINSGSAMVVNIANYSTTMGANQCSAPLEGDQEFFLRSMVYIPSGQSETGYAYVSIRFYGLPDCQGNVLLSDFSSQVYTTTPDQWIESSLLLMAPPNAQSALVWLSIRKNEDSGSLAIAFDNASLFAVEIFADGFESGDTSAWSATVP